MLLFCGAPCMSVELMGWIRRRLRMKKMREWKSWKAIHGALRARGYKGSLEKISMNQLRNSASPVQNLALPNKWSDEIGLINLAKISAGILWQLY